MVFIYVFVDMDGNDVIVGVILFKVVQYFDGSDVSLRVLELQLDIVYWFNSVIGVNEIDLDVIFLVIKFDICDLVINLLFGIIIVQVFYQGW